MALSNTERQRRFRERLKTEREEFLEHIEVIHDEIERLYEENKKLRQAALAGAGSRPLAGREEKLAKLVLMLSPETAECEKLNAVEAINRTLKSAGLSLHDLVDLIRDRGVA